MVIANKKTIKFNINHAILVNTNDTKNVRTVFETLKKF